MSDALVRQWTLLRLVPRAPTKIDSTELHRRLRDDHGIDTTPRTVQRDLLKLQAIFPLACDYKGQHFGWSWDRNAHAFDLPGMDTQTALTLRLAATFLPRVLPRATLRFLDPHFKRANAVLEEKLGRQQHRAWASKVRMVQRGLSLVPPKVKPEVLDVVYDAVFEERCFEARYVPRRDGEAKTRVIHPLGLIYRDAAAYLVCMIGEHTGLVTLALHRIESAKRLASPRRNAETFDIDAYVASGSAGYRYREEPLELEALVDPSLATVLAESPLSNQQQLEPTADGRLRLRSTLPDNWDLRAWVLQQGDAIEVIKPESLRRAIADMLESAATLYGRASQRHPRENPVGWLMPGK